MSVLLPTKNAGPALDGLLARVFAQRTTFPFEVVVVDSGSRDETLDALVKHPVRVYHISGDEFGHGATRNLLASLARGEFLVFVTQDAVPADDVWLESLVAPLREPKVAGAYARQLPRPESDPVTRFFLQEIYPPVSRTQEGGEPSLADLHFSNASSAMRRSVWESTPFREDVIMAEDQEWSARALRKGFRIRYEAGARVEHAHDFSLAETFRRYFDSGVSYCDVYAASRSKRSFSVEFATAGVRHVARKLAWLAREGEARWIPFALALSAVKGAAVLLGRNYRFLPRRLCVALSQHKYHWTRPPRALRVQPSARPAPALPPGAEAPGAGPP